MMIGFREPACRSPYFWKMASVRPHGSDLWPDLAIELKYNHMVIEDLKKRVKVLEKQEPNQANINLLQTHKLNILQLETEINDLKDKLDRL